MDTETLKKWKEYKQAVEDHNRPILKAWEKLSASQWENFKKRKAHREEIYEKENKKYMARLKEQAEWDELPMHKKLFKTPPPELYSFERPRYPFTPMPALLFPAGLRHASWEGFLDWLNEGERI